MALQFRVLGSLEVADNGSPVELRRHKPRALLALFLLHANEPLSTDRLVDALWGEQAPARAVGSLQNYVSQLRKLLGPELIVSSPGGYTLRIDEEQLDLTRFERLVAQSRGTETAERAARLAEALDFWRGEPLAEFRFEPFAQTEIPRLEELRLSTVEERIEADLALGRHAQLVSELESLVAHHPLRERFRGQLMLALYGSGRQAEALHAYQDARRILLDELGLEPGPNLQQLERQILRHAPEVAPPERATPAVAAPATPVPTLRKVVTIVFCDVVGSTALGDSLDPEPLHDVMSSFFAEMRAAIEHHGGTVEKFAGDAVMAVFGVPVSHEDDALRAVRAAAQMRSALATLNESLADSRGVRLELRTAIHTGEVVAGDPAARQAFVTGDAVNVCKRLEEAAPAGEILLGPSTYRLVRDAVSAESFGPLELRGKGEPFPAFRLVELVEGAPGIARRFEAKLVGRDLELSRLRHEFALAVDEQKPRVAAIVGEAGIGKTRLANELLASVRDEASILVGRCVSYGAGATYLPLAEMVRQATGGEPSVASIAALVDDEDADQIAQRVAEAVGIVEGTGMREDTSWAVRRLLESLAHKRPLVVALDDVHWAEATLLDLVEYVLEWGSAAPILIVCTARPELLQERPAWMKSAIELEALGAGDAGALVEDLADEELPEETRARIVEVAEGNPLFVEQLLAYAEEEGALEAVPPSLEALLASRIDRLDQPERAALGRAAVVGREFWRSAVIELSPVDEAAAVERHLMSLVRKGLVRAGRSSLPREDAFRFHHVLIRDVTYAALPKSTRADLHERCAEWLERHSDGYDELVGFHLEQAFLYQSELGKVDRGVRRLGEEAGERLGRAGFRALMRGDFPAAANLLPRGVELLGADNARGRELMCELAVALRSGGDSERATRVLEEAIDAARAALDRRSELRAQIELGYVQVFTQPEQAEQTLERTREAITTLESFDDDRALGRAWVLVGIVQGSFFCQNGLWEEAAERALDHYNRLGLPTGLPIGAIAAALYYGPKPVPEAVARCEALLESADGGRSAAANVLVWLGGLEAQRGNFDDARLLVNRAAQTFVELGGEFSVATTTAHVRGAIELLAGDLGAAEAVFRGACETFERFRAWPYVSTLAAELADVLCWQGSLDEADRWSRVAEEHASSDDVSAQFSWSAARARVLARRGLFEEGETLARRAVGIVEQTDAVSQHASVLIALAEVLHLQGRDAEADTVLDEALRLYEAKGNVAAAALARALRAEFATA
jgi:class 3 adenylate cyclase